MHTNKVTDEREGQIVCVDCGLVLTDKIFLEYNQFSNDEHNNLSNKVKDILEKLNLPYCFVSDIVRKYLSLQHKKFLLEYVVYLTLHESGFPISIKDISSVTGISHSRIYDLQENDQSICLRPQDLLEKYCTLLQLDYKTYSLIKKELIPEIQTGHNPLTVIAATIYTFSKKNKLKLSMKQIANVVKISSVSIQRYIKTC